MVGEENKMALDTYEKVEKYLESYQELNYDIILYENKMGGLKAISYSQEEKGTAQNDTMLVYMQKIEKCRSNQKEIEEFIEKSFSGRDKAMIYEKYVCDHSYVSIGNKHHFSSTHVKRLIRKAIYKYLAK